MASSVSNNYNCSTGGSTLPLNINVSSASVSNHHTLNNHHHHHHHHQQQPHLHQNGVLNGNGTLPSYHQGQQHSVSVPMFVPPFPPPNRPPPPFPAPRRPPPPTPAPLWAWQLQLIPDYHYFQVSTLLPYLLSLRRRVVWITAAVVTHFGYFLFSLLNANSLINFLSLAFTMTHSSPLFGSTSISPRETMVVVQWLPLVPLSPPPSQFEVCVLFFMSQFPGSSQSHKSGLGSESFPTFCFISPFQLHLHLLTRTHTPRD